jgi:hypothetical protein
MGWVVKSKEVSREFVSVRREETVSAERALGMRR